MKRNVIIIYKSIAILFSIITILYSAWAVCNLLGIYYDRILLRPSHEDITLIEDTFALSLPSDSEVKYIRVQISTFRPNLYIHMKLQLPENQQSDLFVDSWVSLNSDMYLSNKEVEAYRESGNFMANGVIYDCPNISEYKDMIEPSKWSILLLCGITIVLIYFYKVNKKRYMKITRD